MTGHVIYWLSTIGLDDPLASAFGVSFFLVETGTRTAARL